MDFDTQVLKQAESVEGALVQLVQLSAFRPQSGHPLPARMSRVRRPAPCTVRGGLLATQEFIVNFHQARDELLATRPFASSFFRDLWLRA